MRHFQYFGQNIGVRQLIANPKSIKRGGVRQHFSLASYGPFQGTKRRHKLRLMRADAAEKDTKPPLRKRSVENAFWPPGPAAALTTCTALMRAADRGAPFPPLPRPFLSYFTIHLEISFTGQVPVGDVHNN